MGKTWRNEPSNGAYLRKPKHIRAKREILRTEDEGYCTNRKAIPPSDWDDIVVSHYRGQHWHRKHDE